MIEIINNKRRDFDYRKYPKKNRLSTDRTSRKDRCIRGGDR